MTGSEIGKQILTNKKQAEPGRQDPGKTKGDMEMILNACTLQHKMVDEKICKECQVKTCRHAGEPTTKERLDMATYGTKAYWDGEKDEAI